MHPIKALLVTLSVFLYAVQLHAHGYWIELEGSKKLHKPCIIKLYYGDYPVGERLSGKTLDKMKDIRVYVIAPSGEKQPVEMIQHHDYWQGSFIPQSKGRYEVTGINDERAVQDWTRHHLGITRPVQYLKMSYDVGKATGEVTDLYLDAYVQRISKGNYEVTLLKDGKALSEQKFVLSRYDKGDEDFVTDNHGKANISMQKPGLYILSTDWIDTDPGTFKGKEYETVRHRLDVSLKN